MTYAKHIDVMHRCLGGHNVDSEQLKETFTAAIDIFRVADRIEPSHDELRAYTRGLQAELTAARAEIHRQHVIISREQAEIERLRAENDDMSRRLGAWK